MKVLTKRLLVGGFTAALTLGTLTSTGVAASYATPTVSSVGAPDLSSITSYRAELEARGIPLSVQDRLINAIESGQGLEADDPDATPVETTTTVRDGYSITTSTFSDGSFIETGREIPATTSPGGIAARGIENCVSNSVSGGTKYSNCKLYSWAGSLAMSFYATYTIYPNSSDVINSVWGESWSAPFYTQETASLSITRGTENASGPATAQYYLKLSMVVKEVPLKLTRSFYLFAGGNTAWDQWA